MVEKISVQIALEGGKEVQRQLEGIGEAGQKAFEDITRSAEQVGGFKNLNPEDVTTKLKSLGVEGTAAFDKIQQAVKTASRFETLVQGVQSVETALAALGRAAGPVGAAIAAAFVAASKATIAFSETIGKISDEAVKLGVSFERFKELRQELARVGITGDDAAKGLEHFQKQLGEPSQQFFSVLTQTGEVIRFVADTSNLAADKIGAFIEKLRQMPNTVERTNLALQTLGEAAGTEVIQGLRRAEGSMSDSEAKAYDLQQALKQLKAAWDELGSVALAPTLTQQINTLTSAIQTLSDLVNNFSWAALADAGVSALSALNSALNPTPQFIRDIASAVASIAWDTISGAGVAAWNALKSAVESAGSAVASFASSLGGIVWDAISGVGVAAWNALTGAIENAINKLLQFIGLKPSAPATGGGAPGAARGGLLGGRGTGTSDSNLAWLSRGEYVTPARAVRQPGVLAFLEALRRSGGNLRNVLDGMGRFALGGLVPRPAFAAGGPVGGMSNVTINFPGLQPISGLRANDAVVDELRKAAALAQVRSGGRKPSRYS